MRVAIYARVSTADQNCEMQLREMRQYCAARGWTEVEEYVDSGWSGAKASRPTLDRMTADCRKRLVDTVMVWKLDRLGRSLTHTVSLVQEFNGLGIRFISMTQGIDTDCNNPAARFFLHMFAAFAEFEREMIRERTFAGVQNARAKGKTLGRPQRVFRRDEAVRMKAEGLSWKQIADALGVPVGTVRSAVGKLKGE